MADDDVGAARRDRAQQMPRLVGEDPQLGPVGPSRMVIDHVARSLRIEQTLEGRGAAANDVNMLVSTGGRQRSEAEFRELYAASGFRLTEVVPTLARVSVIEGAPA